MVSARSLSRGRRAAALAAEHGLSLRGDRPLPPELAYLEISDRERDGGGRTTLQRLRELVGLGQVRPGAHVLDVGAGQGWHALRLAPRYEVSGVEPSGLLARVARRRARVVGQPLVMHRATAQQLPIAERSVDLALALNTVLGYGEPDDDAEALSELCRVLRPGARAVVELASPDALDEAEPSVATLAGGAVVERLPSFDRLDQRLDEVETVVLANGTWGAFEYSLRLADAGSWIDLAREAGFADVEVANRTITGSDRRGPTVLVCRSSPSRPAFAQ